jgi:hypothetical protein
VRCSEIHRRGLNNDDEVEKPGEAQRTVGSELTVDYETGAKTSERSFKSQMVYDRKHLKKAL